MKWHNAVAKASGNELLSTLLFSISHGVQLATRAEEYDTPRTRREVVEVQHMTASRPHSLATLSSEVPLAEAVEETRLSLKSPRRSKSSKPDVTRS